MTHILKAEEFLMESRGAKLIDRTPDRFNSDPLANKEENSLLMKQINIDKQSIRRYINDEIYNDINYTDVFDLADTDDSKGFIEIRSGNFDDTLNMYIYLDDFKHIYCENINESQFNALDMTGLYSSDYSTRNSLFTKFNKFLISHLNNFSLEEQRENTRKGNKTNVYSNSKQQIFLSIDDIYLENNDSYLLKITPFEQMFKNRNSNTVNILKKAYANTVNEILHIFDKEIFERILDKKMQ